MDAAYSYGLVVELEGNHIKKLKNKLLKYFQSKKSNGGECQIQYEDFSGTARLFFRKEEDRGNVLAKRVHEIVLEQGVLTMIVHLPDEGSGTESITSSDKKQTPSGGSVAEVESQRGADGAGARSEEEPVLSTSAVLGNIPQDMSQDFLEMLVENICRGSAHIGQEKYSLETISDLCSAVVTFSSEKESTAFITSCPSNSRFTNNKLSVRALEVTAKVKVEELPNVRPDLLLLYFENEGFEVEAVVPVEEEKSAIVSFKMAKAVPRIITKEHLIGKTLVKVFPFYDSLGTALYGKERPALKLPSAFSESLHPAVWTYLHRRKKALETLCHCMTDHLCQVELLQSSVRLTPLPALLQRDGITAKDLREWKPSAKLAFTEALTRFKTLRFEVNSPAWGESERQIRAAVSTEAVEVISSEAEQALSVVGFVDVVTRLEPALKELLDRILKEMHREQASITHGVDMSPDVFHLLCQAGLIDQLKKKYPEIKVAYKEKLILNGLNHEVLDTASMVINRVLSLKQSMLDLDDDLFRFVKNEDREKLTSALFASRGIDAALEVCATAVKVLAVSDHDLSQAKVRVEETFTSQHVPVEDRSVLKTPQWQSLVKCLQEKANGTSQNIVITESRAHQLNRIVVSGYKDGVMAVCKTLEDHLYGHTQVEDTIEVKPNIIVKFIENKIDTIPEKVKENVHISFGRESIDFRGSRVDVKDCKTKFSALVSTVCFQEYVTSEPGAREYFLDKEMYVTSLIKDLCCLVQLVDEPGSGNDSRPKPVYELTISNGIEIAVCQGDLCRYQVDAIVISSNKDFNHGGVDGTGPGAAGQQLKPGKSVMTDAGGSHLCKKIIYSRGPRYDQADQQKAVAQLKRTVKGSLELAEQSDCLSLAMSAAGADLGFPPSLCANTVAKAIQAHCDDHYGESTLMKIHLVSNDNNAVQAMVDAVRDTFGSHGISYSQPSSPKKSPKHVVTPSKHGATVNGLNIQLLEGNIEDAKTQVVVNIVGQNFDLGVGAVSKAIFGAAGHKLQKLVNEKMTQGNFGDVVITKGCKLKSGTVFHAVAPFWDKGQGGARKVMSEMVEDCLNKAEVGGFNSITFPAIGTGNLGFPKDLAATIMIEEVVKFGTKKRPKHLTTVVIVLYPQDAATIQAFNDELKKQLSPIAGAPQPTKTQSILPNPKVSSTLGKHDIAIGDVIVQVVCGDITKETTNVIVNSSNESFDLKSGVSKAILDAAGPAVENECKMKGDQPNQGMIMTEPGHLKCQSILHMSGRNDPQRIRRAMVDALLMCVQGGYTSVSFPALGTGQGSAQADQVADAMLEAVGDVVDQGAQGSLTTVRLVVFQQTMVKDFLSSMHKKADADKQKSGGFSNKVKAAASTLFGGGGASKAQNDDDFVFDCLDVEPVCFHVCGHSQAEVDKAIQQISKLISEEQFLIPINDKAILNLTKEDYVRIVDIQSATNVRIERKHARFVIEGINKNVLKASTEIQDLLRKVKEEEEIKKCQEMIDWQYELQGETFQKFDPVSNYQLEQALKDDQANVEVRIQGKVYEVDIANGTATDNQGNSLLIRRIDKMKAQEAVILPRHWDPVPNGTSCHTVSLPFDHPEYIEVLNLFKATCDDIVIEIQRIQNALLWTSLQIKKTDMEVNNRHQNNEKRLFHGACHTTIAHINQLGFNRSYAKSGVLYGKGTYFALEANYSASDGYSKPDPQEQKFMYLCRVLTGDYTQGVPTMVVPPTKSSSSVQQYDSVVDDVANPTIFVIFHDAHAYPEYLIKFKKLV